MRESSNKEFEFIDVITLRPLMINCIVIMVAVFFLGLYYFIMGMNFNLFFLIFTFALIVLGVTLVLKIASHPVCISFMDNSFLISCGQDY